MIRYIKYATLALALYFSPAQAKHAPPSPEAAEAIEDYSWLDAVAQWDRKCDRLSDAERSKLAQLTAENLKDLQNRYGFDAELGAEIAENNKSVVPGMACDDPNMLFMLKSVKAKLTKL